MAAEVAFGVFFLLVICLGALIGNLMLFIIVAKTPELQTKGNVFILNLAAADLLVTINMPITIATVLSEDWVFGGAFCKIAGFLTMLTFVASCMSLTMISVNRYHAIVHWTRYHEKYTRGKCALYLIILWLITVVLSLPPLCGWTSYKFDKNQSYCFAEWAQSKAYTLFMIGCCLVCPVCIMSYCYIRILRFKKQSRMRVEGVPAAALSQAETTTYTASVTVGQTTRCSQNGARSDRKLTRTIMSLIVVFALCWSPFAIIMLVEVFAGSKIPHSLDFGSLVLGYLNSFCNVIVYNVTNKKIRQGYRKLVCCKQNQVDVGGSSS